MKKYKVLILGYPVKSTSEIKHCLNMMWWNIHESLKLLTDEIEIVPESYDPKFVQYGSPNIYKTSNHLFVKEYIGDVPMVDYIILGTLDCFYTEETMAPLRTKCKKIFSFLEIGEPADFSFIYTDNYYRQRKENCEILPVPYGNFYTNVEKEKNSILFDHSAYLDSPIYTSPEYKAMEMTDKLLGWSEDLKDEYKMYSLLYGGHQKEAVMKILPPFIQPIEQTNMAEYLKLTNKMETFVITHKGSYNLSVIDMLVRGMRIITPNDYIPKYNIDLFNMPTYSDKESFLKEIRKPVDTEYWNKQIEKCTSTEKIADAFLKKFKEG